MCVCVWFVCVMSVIYVCKVYCDCTKYIHTLDRQDFYYCGLVGSCYVSNILMCV
jgi:hypothetical protein